MLAPHQQISFFTGRVFDRPTDPRVTARLDAAKAAAADKNNLALATVQDLSPSLARYMRPQSAFQWWTLPYLSSITPQYIQNVLISALAGNHVQCWQLLDMIIDTNAEAAACVGEYVDGILKKKLIFEPYHEEDEEPTDSAIEKQRIVSAALRNMRPDAAADENNLKGTIRDIAFARFHGQSILEEDWYDTFGTGQINKLDVSGVGSIIAPRSTFWVHPVCYAYDIMGRLGLRIPAENLQQAKKSIDTNLRPGVMPDDFGLTNALSFYGYMGSPRPASLMPFPENEFLVAIQKFKTGSALGASCLRPLAWWWCVSNFAGDWLLDLAQIFGIPFRKATYKQGTGEPQKAEAREMLQNMGSRGWCLLDERVTIEFEKAMESGSGSPQGFLLELADRQIRKVILRQTMTGRDSSTGKGFGTTEQETKHDCIQAGAEFVCDVLRDQMARHILRINYGEDTELPFIRMMQEEEGGVEDAQRDAELAGMGLKIGTKYLRKKYGIPEPSDDEETVGGAPAAGPQSTVPSPQSGKAAKPEAGGQKPETDSTLEASDKSAIGNRQSAIDSAPTEQYQSTALQDYSKAFAEDVQHVLDRLGKILEIQDDAIFKTKLEQFLKDFPALKKDVLADPAAARALQPIIATALANGLASKSPGGPQSTKK
jgi:hypothetical protein